MTTDRDERTARLCAAATARTDESQARAQRAITKLHNTGQPITFVAVARTAGVSTSFLYQHTELRAEIVRRRTRSAPTAAPRPASPATLESLRTKLAAAIARNHQLAEQLAQLTTENQTLRSRLLERRVMHTPSDRTVGGDRHD